MMLKSDKTSSISGFVFGLLAVNNCGTAFRTEAEKQALSKLGYAKKKKDSETVYIRTLCLLN